MNKLEFDVHSLLSFSWSIESRNQRNLQILHILPSGLILKLPPVKLLNFPNSSISRHSGENPPSATVGKIHPRHSGENPSSATVGKIRPVTQRGNESNCPRDSTSLNLPCGFNITTVSVHYYNHYLQIQMSQKACLGCVMHTVQRAQLMLQNFAFALVLKTLLMPNVRFNTTICISYIGI